MSNYVFSESPRQRFTGKERDTESGLDYFGARYMSSAQGRFTSPDPTFLNIRKVFNPQRWNLYGYSVNNPFKFVDPDGNEAIAVYYPGYQVAVHGNFTAPLGHAGVVVVAKDGSTHYFEYGRYAPAGAGGDVAQGVVRNAGPTAASTPDIQRDASGKITPDSMKALLSTLSETAGKHGEVDVVVLNTNDSEDVAMEAYLEQRERQNSDPNRQHYSISQGHNCGTLICDALGAAGRRSPTPYSFSTPGGIFGQFLTWQQLYGVTQTFVYAPKKEDVSSKICYVADGKTVCQ